MSVELTEAEVDTLWTSHESGDFTALTSTVERLISVRLGYDAGRALREAAHAEFERDGATMLVERLLARAVATEGGERERSDDHGGRGLCERDAS